jgi:branched-chain amino acid transport system substrate-binding protein
MGYTFTPVVYAAAAYVKDQAHLPMIVSANATGEGLFLDPKLASPYLTRFTENSAAYSAAAADWAYKQGYRKAILLTYDTAAGIENADFWARAFVDRGGQIVQEFHPPANTSDYGTYLAQMDKNADIVLEFAPGADGLRMLQQFANYTGDKKPLFFDLGAVATGGPNLDELKDKAVGVVANKAWVESLDNPENQTFLKALAAKYPGRTPSADLAMGWASGILLKTALERVDGNVEGTDAFLKGLYGLTFKAPKGDVKLDDGHDIQQNYYVYKIVKQGDKYTQQVVDTYKDVSRYYDIKADDMKRFPFGQLKGKWVGMTKDKLPTLLK